MRGTLRFARVLAAVGCSVWMGLGIPAATIVVDGTGPADFTAIQPAIDAAQPGDTVLVKPGEYVITASINLRGKAIELRSEAGAAATTIRMAETPAEPDAASVVVFDGGETRATVLDGFTVTGGQGLFRGLDSAGGGVFCRSASPTIRSCIISGNTSRGGFVVGGGVTCADASPWIADCIIARNTSHGLYSGGGGLVCTGSSSPALTGCTITGNVAYCAGAGGVFCTYSSSPTLTDCWITGNFAAFGGGGLCCERAAPELSRCTIAGNCASGGAGGIYALYAFGDSPKLTGCIVWDNAAPEGDLATYEAFTTIAVSNSCVAGTPVWPGEGNTNEDPRFWGWETGEVWVDASRGGPGAGTREDPYSSLGLALGGYRLHLTAGSPCIGTGLDGADMGAPLERRAGKGAERRRVHLAPGTYPIDGFNLAHGASLEGAGHEATVVEGTVHGLRTAAMLAGLTVTGGRHSGVVVVSGAAPEIRDCRLLGNRALSVHFFGWTESAGHGGGLYCVGASPTLVNCSIVGSGGVGVLCQRAAAPRLLHCTIAGNWSGLRCLGSSVPILTNCVIAENLTRGSSASDITTDGSGEPLITYSLIGGDIFFQAAGAWEDADGDGPNDVWVWTPGDYRLSGDSPCIDTGTCDGAPPLDLDGNVRPAGAGCDMGAYEFGSAPPPGPRFRRGDTNGDATLDMSDAIATLGHLFLGQPAALECAKAADADDSGEVDISDAVFTLGYLFLGAAAPPAPFEACGIDGHSDGLACEAPGPCE